MNKIIGIILLVVFSYSCQQKVKEQSVVSMEEFAGETGDIVFEDLQEIDTNSIVEMVTQLDAFIDAEKEGYTTDISTDFHPIDRFSFNTSTKVNFTGKNQVPYGKSETITPNATVFYYTFSDTTKTKNALYNWLDCFGDECKIVKLYEDISHLKTTPIFSLIYDTEIVVVNYRCEDQKNDWKSFEKELIKQFGKTYNYRLKVGCGGPLKWE